MGKYDETKFYYMGRRFSELSREELFDLYVDTNNRLAKERDEKNRATLSDFREKFQNARDLRSARLLRGLYLKALIASWVFIIVWLIIISV